jgi:acetyl/propionyl-CoA carboxylase alpha subunit
VVNTFLRTFNVEIIDAETKYRHSRLQGLEHEGENDISSPMPGKVIKVPVTIGETVTSGQTIIVVEAMKMHSLPQLLERNHLSLKSPQAKLLHLTYVMLKEPFFHL